MLRLPSRLTYTALLLSFGLLSCSTPEVTDVTSDSPIDGATGQLILVANGEERIREGFVSKDGWQLEFDHAFVNFGEVKAYQTDPPFDANSKSELKAKETVTFLEKSQTVDLVTGDTEADLTTVQEVTAPVGHYNSLAWRLARGNEGEVANATLVLIGRATKDGETIDFTLNFQEELNYVCGEFVGEERKGYLTQNDRAEVETTFHFDHLFGEGRKPADDTLNVEALGFGPLAALAENGQLIIDQETLEERLSPSDVEKLRYSLVGLGHVGEGHCRYQES